MTDYEFLHIQKKLECAVYFFLIKASHPENMRKLLEIRRHTMRRKPELHLTTDGIQLANRVGATMDHFDQVVTSELPRAYETAVAMGYEITYSYAELGALPDAVADAVSWPGPIERIRGEALDSPAVRNYSDEQAKRVREIVTITGDEQTHTLLISHGIIMELTLLALTGWAEISNSEDVFGYCEGYVLTYNGSSFTLSDLKRLSNDLRIVDTKS